MMLRELLLEVFLVLTQFNCVTWATLSGVCTVCLHYHPSLLAMIWDWLLLNTLDYSLLIVFDIDISFFISALDLKQVLLVFFFFPSSPQPPYLQSSCMNLKSEAKLPSWSWWKLSFKALSPGWVTGSLTEGFTGLLFDSNYQPWLCSSFKSND